MVQTFTARAERRLTETSFPRGEDTFVIHMEPVETQHDGYKTISMGFPVLAVSDWVAGKEEFAKKVAELLTANNAKKPAAPPSELQAALDLVCGWADGTVDANCSDALSAAAQIVRGSFQAQQAAS
jgi:hypothetical protein